MQLSLEKVDPSSLEEAICFLKRHENYSLFLLGNLKAHGPNLSGDPNSANYKIIRSPQEILAVFALTHRGNLLVQSIIQKPLFELLLTSCLEESIPITGLIGEWDFCSSFWGFLKEKKIIQTELFTTKEILYSKNLSSTSVSSNPSIRYLVAKDYSQWTIFRTNYLIESGLPQDLSEKEQLAQFLKKVQEQIIWGCFFKEKLTSTAELNAIASGIGQVGGVYTAPDFRRKGYAKKLMLQLMSDAFTTHKLSKLLIFTGETNSEANNLYKSLEVDPIGYFALFFGKNNP